MTQQEIKFAQKEVFRAGNILSSVGLRVNGSKYYNIYKKMYDALNELNHMLIKDLR